jgi:hypothetical protein
MDTRGAGTYTILAKPLDHLIMLGHLNRVEAVVHNRFEPLIVDIKDGELKVEPMQLTISII